MGQSALVGVPSQKYVLGVSIGLLGLLRSSRSLAVSTKGNKNIFCEVFMAVKKFRCVAGGRFIGPKSATPLASCPHGRQGLFPF